MDKHLIKKAAIVIVIIVVFLLPGPNSRSAYDDPYPFRQEFEQIMSIEILRKEHDSILITTPMYVVKVLDPSEHRAIVDAILETECFRPPAEDPCSGVGLYIIRITYKNGDQELIGNYNNAYKTADGEIIQYDYALKREPYYDIISEFLGREITDYTYGSNE